MVNGFNKNQLALAGINDDSFKTAYESAGKAQLNARDAALKKLLQGQAEEAKIKELVTKDQMDRKLQEDNLVTAQGIIDQGAKQGRRLSANLSGNGGVSLSQGDAAGANPLVQLKMAEMKQNQDDAKLATYGKRNEQANVPARLADFASAEKATQSTNPDGTPKAGGIITDPNYKAKSAGGFTNFIPDFIKPGIVGLGEKMGMYEKGSSDEMQAIQRLVNAEIKGLSGTAVSQHEMGRNLVSQGMSPGGDPTQVVKGVQMMRQALEGQVQNIDASTPAPVRERYQQQGGINNINDLLGRSKPAMDPKARMEELRRKKAGG